MSGKQILLVEDNPGIRLALSRALESHGHSVAQASDAIVALTSANFDVLVLDINLPDMTGWDVLRHIASDDMPPMPLIVMSAVPPSVARLREFRPIGVLAKPFPVDVLHRMVDGVSAPALERTVNE